ncbi:efflux RND transporter periplasmic adaptor subunit [Chitinophaga sp. CF418]|uniref:efflux RND transporter periplasmic adaptor subunit n=1 Tax=Chitinophaga sp. CF418 TaxID=1855287 RepID=UPI000911932F|nr:efflux RND transporter periplasmic adaptor subunit [Chitinophaga sp. CF418]SHM95486.1 RND family efflux transporter, MFP subunit [Chitinophaga sp. CF418]
MKKIIRYSITAAVLFLSVGFIAVKLNSNKKEVVEKVYHKDPNLKATVQADTIKYTPFTETAAFLGSFVPDREVIIASETTGKVVRINVREGSQVSAGSLIAQLDTDLLQAQLQSALANYDNAALTLRRYEQAVNGVTKLQIDNARTQLLTDKAQIDQLRKQISMCSIKAPFGGIITSKNFELGAVVSAGAQMAQLTDISRLKLEISVPEKNIMQFRKEQALTVVTDVYPDEKFQGHVDMIAAKADASHNYAVKILVTNNAATALKAGMYGRISFSDVTTKEAISIPRSALVGSSSRPQVFVIENGIARLRNIQTGGSNETIIQVTSGLQPGDIVATGGLINLTEGSKVSIAK